MWEADSVRLDRWLWAARFFKTRRLAIDAIRGGHVQVEGVRAKPARAVKPGQQVVVRKAAQTFEVEVLQVSDQRGPAREAEQLYRETEDSQQRRAGQREAARLAAAAQPRPEHRPERRDRRQLAAFKRGSRD